MVEIQSTKNVKIMFLERRHTVLQGHVTVILLLLSLCVVPCHAQTLPPACLQSTLLGTHSLKAAVSMSEWSLPQSKAVEGTLVHHR